MSNTGIMLVYDSDIFIHIPWYGNPGWIMVGTTGIIAETLRPYIKSLWSFYLSSLR